VHVVVFSVENESDYTIPGIIIILDIVMRQTDRLLWQAHRQIAILWPPLQDLAGEMFEENFQRLMADNWLKQFR